MNPKEMEVMVRKAKEGIEMRKEIIPIIEKYDVDIGIGVFAVMFREIFDQVESKEYKKAYLMEFTNWIHQESKKVNK